MLREIQNESFVRKANCLKQSNYGQTEKRIQVNAPIAAMTMDSSIDFAVFSSCTIYDCTLHRTPTVSLCHSVTPTPSTTNQLCQQALQSHAPKAIINQLTKTDQHPSYRNSPHRQNNPSEGKTNAFIQQQTSNQLTKTAQHPN